MKRVGTIAQFNNGGIAIQSLSFCQNLRPDKVLLTDLTTFHEAAGKKVVNYPSRFDEFDTRTTNGLPTYEDIDWLLTDIDVLYFIETALNWQMLVEAKKRSIRVIQHANWELLDKIDPVYSWYEAPTELFLPSSWHYADMEKTAKEWGCKLRLVPVPVDREKIPFRPRRKARTFLHVAGHEAAHDRNGTHIVAQAIPMVRNKDVRFVIRSQRPLPQFDFEDDRVRVYTKEVRDYWDIYNSDFDVLLLPRRYGGLSLQRDEALSSGAPVISLDTPPSAGELPQEWLVPAHYQKTITTRPTFDIYECTPEDLAAKIDYVAALSEFTFTNWSHKADFLAEKISWGRQLPVYRALLDGENPPEPTTPESSLFWS